MCIHACLFLNFKADSRQVSTRYLMQHITTPLENFQLDILDTLHQRTYTCSAGLAHMYSVGVVKRSEAQAAEMSMILTSSQMLRIYISLPSLVLLPMPSLSQPVTYTALYIGATLVHATKSHAYHRKSPNVW